MDNLCKLAIKIFTATYVLLLSNTVFAAVPFLNQTSTINFGNLIFIPGGCDMAYDTKTIVNNTSANICIDPEGQLGKYRITADPSIPITITVKTHNDDGSGIIYVPNGQAVSDTESKLLSANIATVIDSGTSGFIDITLGGRIQVSVTLSASSSYDESFDIEFTE